MSCVYHTVWFHRPKNTLCFTVPPSCSPDNHWPLHSSYSSVFSRMLCSWNHIMCSLLRLASFTCQHICPLLAGSSFCFITESLASRSVSYESNCLMYSCQGFFFFVEISLGKYWLRWVNTQVCDCFVVWWECVELRQKLQTACPAAAPWAVGIFLLPCQHVLVSTFFAFQWF